MNENFSDDDLSEKVPVTRWNVAEIAQMLGRVESTLLDMRSDIRTSTEIQNRLSDKIEGVTDRVSELEIRERGRTKLSRVIGTVLLVLILPAINLVRNVHDWFDIVDDVCYPKDQPSLPRSKEGNKTQPRQAP